MSRAKIYNKDGMSYTPETMKLSLRIKEAVKKIWREGRQAGFDLVDLNFIIVRDTMFRTDMEMFLERAAVWKKRSAKKRRK